MVSQARVGLYNPMHSLLLSTLIWSGLSAAQAPQQPAHEAPGVQVYAIEGEISAKAARESCKTIEKNFSLPCQWAFKDLSSVWNSPDSRIDAAAFLDARFEQSISETQLHQAKSKAGKIELWLTSKDLYEGGRPFVFGITSMTDRIALVSTYRLKHPKSAKITSMRLEKVVVHELAHALDLGHHDQDNCVMQIEPDIAHLDGGSTTLCTRCRGLAAQATRRFHRKGQFLWDRALGSKVRGNIPYTQRLLSPLVKNGGIDPIIEIRAKQLWASLLRVGSSTVSP